MSNGQGVMQNWSWRDRFGTWIEMIIEPVGSDESPLRTGRKSIYSLGVLPHVGYVRYGWLYSKGYWEGYPTGRSTQKEQHFEYLEEKESRRWSVVSDAIERSRRMRSEKRILYLASKRLLVTSEQFHLNDVSCQTAKGWEENENIYARRVNSFF